VTFNVFGHTDRGDFNGVLSDIGIADGQHAEFSVLQIAGQTTSLSSGGFTDIWDPGGELQYLTSAQTHEIVSVSTNDTLAGTGAQTAIVFGLDSSFLEILEVVALNGTTPVTLANTYIRIRQFAVFSAGSLAKNDGNITITETSGSTVQGLIPAERYNSFTGNFTIPLNKRAWALAFSLNAPKNEDIEMMILARTFGSTSWLNLGVVFCFETFTRFPFKVIAALPEKADLRFSATASQANTKAVITAELVLEDTTI